MMYKTTFLFTLTILIVTSVWALENGTIETLIKEKKYSSAFKQLKAADPKLGDPKIVSKMAEVATRYYVFCMEHEYFAFKDLSSGENINQIRGTQGTYDMHHFKLENELMSLNKKYPESGEILLAIANFYFSGICDLPQSKVALAESYYKKAEGLVTFDYLANHNMGVIHLQNGMIKEAVNYLLVSNNQNKQFGGTQYNLAYAYNALGKPQKAVPYAEKAFELYKDNKLKSEAALLAAFMNLDVKNKKNALRFAALANQYKYQNHYHILSKLLGMYLEMDEIQLADQTADDLLKLDPTNSRLSEDALTLYTEFGKNSEFLKYLSRNIKVYSNDSMALGNLFFQKGKYYYFYETDHKKAITAFKTAQSNFLKVVKAGHPALAAINRVLKELETK